MLFLATLAIQKNNSFPHTTPHLAAEQNADLRFQIRVLLYDGDGIAVFDLPAGDHIATYASPVYQRLEDGFAKHRLQIGTGITEANDVEHDRANLHFLANERIEPNTACGQIATA